MINYYNEFELNPQMDSKSICEKLFKDKKVWSKRQNAADLEKRQEAERKVPLIDEAMSIFSNEDKRKAYDNELRQAAAAQQQAQQAQRQDQQAQYQQQTQYQQQAQYQQQTQYQQQARYQQQAQYQRQPQYQQPNPNRSAYGNGYSRTGVSFKNNAKLTGIVCYLHWIGWLISFFAGDREGAKVHLNSTAVLFLLSIICTLGARLGSVFAVVFGIAQFGIVILWIIGFIYALKGDNKELPVIGGIHIIK